MMEEQTHDSVNDGSGSPRRAAPAEDERDGTASSAPDVTSLLAAITEVAPGPSSRAVDNWPQTSTVLAACREIVAAAGTPDAYRPLIETLMLCVVNLELLVRERIRQDDRPVGKCEF